MNQVETFLSMVDVLPPDQTLNLYQEEEIEERQLRVEELASELNSDRASFTGLQRWNGSSDAISINATELLFCPTRQLSSKEYFQAIQKWEGQVTSVEECSFHVKLRPIIGDYVAEQETEIYKEEVDLSDRSLIEIGAVFYWSIGYLDRPAGRLRASVLRFRRLPKWTEQELREAKLEAVSLKDLLDVE